LNDNVEMSPAMPRAGGHEFRRGYVDEVPLISQASAALRLLVAVPFSPRRHAEHGGRVIAQLLYRLVERHRVAIVYLRRAGSAPIDPQLAGRCDLVHEIPVSDHKSAGFAWRHRLDVLAAPLTGIPSPVAPLHARRFARACVDIANRWGPDIIQIEHDDLGYCGPLLRKSGSTAVRILTSHQPGAPASEDQARATRGRQRIAHRLDAANWRRYWARTLPTFDAVVTLTDRDRDVIEAAASGPRVISIGLGIDLPKEPLSATGDSDPNVLFVGGYMHPPNTDAALRLLRSIMPAVRQSLPGLHLTLVGADPGRELLSAATQDDTVTGYVPTVTPFLDRASLLVLPIRHGGGMRVKLLEALAAGKAVVTSPLAAAGLEVTDGQEVVLAETDAEFTDAIVSLVGDTAARSRLGQRARKWALRSLAWDDRVWEYEQLYRSLLASRKGF
jgi:polysaccharide biosynthesis protein PslH